MKESWIVTIPPLLVILSVLITRHMIASFLVGIVTSALIVTEGNLYQTLLLSAKKLWESSGLESLSSTEALVNSWNLLTFSFLIMIGILITILSKTGSAQSYIQTVQKRIVGKKSVEIASLVLSLLFFIDDYFSALTVGSVMRPLAQLYRVHPLKMAFLTTTMASPITILSPISSWIGEIVLQLKQTGVGPMSPTTVIAADPYFVFVKTIPYLAYPIILVVSVWYIVLRGISYGSMKKYDNLPLEKEAITPSTIVGKGSLFDFLFPILLLITGVIGILFYTGDFYLFGGVNSLIESIKAGSIQQALFIGCFISILVSSVYFIFKKRMSPTNFGECIVEGFQLMFPSIIMLICAWSLGSILKNDLRTGSYLATVFSSSFSLELLPFLSFFSASIIAFLLGSAWAALGLMLPITIDMIQKLLQLSYNTPLDSVPLLFPIIGAVLSGCIFGTHLSVLSDNPIMSSASTGANHIEHIKTMAWYVIPMGIATALSFTLMGTSYQLIGTGSLYLSLLGGLIGSLILLELGQKYFG